MPLIHGKSKESVSKNIATEMDSGKPQKQAVAIAMDIRRKAKAKKMAQGGWVEEETLGHSDDHHFGNEHADEPEPEQHNLHGTGFKESDIDDHDESYDVQPGKFAHGGYTDGGEAHPLSVLLKKPFLKARKMAYGGLLEDDREELGKSYGSNEEDNYQTEHMQAGTARPARHETSEEDKDRVAFVRRYLTHKAMRR